MNILRWVIFQNDFWWWDRFLILNVSVFLNCWSFSTIFMVLKAHCTPPQNHQIAKECETKDKKRIKKLWADKLWKENNWKLDSKCKFTGCKWECRCISICRVPSIKMNFWLWIKQGWSKEFFSSLWTKQFVVIFIFI